MGVIFYVALLRGINLGGKNKIAMADLRTLIESLGYEDVRTYVQTGNVLFQSTSSGETRIVNELERGIAERFELQVPVVVRTARQLAMASERNPHLSITDDFTKLHMIFLVDVPSTNAVASLDPNESSTDRFTVSGREIYLHLPNGAARTKLTEAHD